MLDLGLFRKPAFNGVSAVAFGLSAGMFAMFLYLTIYMQGVLDFSPLEAGLRFLPLTVLSFVASPIAGALSHRVPIRVLLGVGLALVGVGLLLMHGVSSRTRPGRRCCRASSSPASASAPPTPGSARRRSPSSRSRNRAWARGSTRPSARSGSPPASPSLGAVFQSRVDSKLAKLLPERARTAWPKRRLRRLAGRRRGLSPAGQRTRSSTPPNVAFVSGFNEILLIAAILSFVGAALGFLLVRSSDFVQPTEAGARPGARRLYAASASGSVVRRVLHRAACCASCGSRTCC